MATKTPIASQNRKNSRQTTGERVRLTVQRKTKETTKGHPNDHADTVGQHGDLQLGLSTSENARKAVKKLPKAHPKAEGSEEPKRV